MTWLATLLMAFTGVCTIASAIQIDRARGQYQEGQWRIFAAGFALMFGASAILAATA